MKPYVWVIIGLVAVIIALILFWPDGQPDDRIKEREAQYERQAAIYKSELAKSDSTINALRQGYKQRAKTDSVKLKAKDKEITTWKQKAAVAVARIPQEARDLYPQVDSALQAKDSVIAQTEAKNGMLQESLTQVGKDFNLLLEQSQIDKRAAEQMILDCEQRHSDIMDLKNRELKKAKRSGKLAKVLIPVAAVAGFLLGGL